MNEKKYECYSKPLHQYLEKNGQEYVRKFVHNKTGVTCYVYEVNEELEKLLRTWTAEKYSD